MATIKFHRVGSPNPQILTSSQGLYVGAELQKQAVKEAVSFLFTPNREGDESQVEVIVTVRKAQAKAGKTNGKKS